MLKRDSALRITVENYPKASIFNHFALIKVIADETFVGKEVRKKDDLMRSVHQ